jgi:Pyruvate/2-oxoacid:ferredoxin oxidoreductase delta subunit
MYENNTPDWQKDVPCYYCFACIHFCPAHAIQIKGGKTSKKSRYHHPSVDAADIAAQKQGVRR